MKYGIYIECPDERRELQVIVYNKYECKRAINMLETYYDVYSHYKVYAEEIDEPKYCHISELKRTYKTLGI